MTEGSGHQVGALGRMREPSLVARLSDGRRCEVPLDGPGEYGLGPLAVGVEETASGWSWWLANRGDQAERVVSLRLRWIEGRAGPAPRIFCNGYQSWSASRLAHLGLDVDPSTTPGSVPLVRGMHHADAAVAPVGSLRSELVTVLDRDEGGEALLAGFTGGSEHDGTLWASLDPERHVELAAEAFLGGVRLQPGESRALHPAVIAEGPRGCAPELLAEWAALTGRVGGARTTGAYQVGWCSWYHYFHDVSEQALLANLALAGDWPFELFQLDDGYQAAVGDWLSTNERFPSGLGWIASEIGRAGLSAGIWLAPFLVAPGSEVACAHPEWVPRHASGKPLVGMVNQAWGGPVLVLDTTVPEVLDHIEQVAAAMRDLGFGYLKLDFTYAPSLEGEYADPSLTPAQRVRAGMEAVRRGAGDDAFLLGCGLPLGAGVGVVDGMRIGPDVAPWWEVQPDQWIPPGYQEIEPATRNAWVNTLTRAFMHRRLWLNDPDCLMLRSEGTRLPPESAKAWALAVAASGGMALLSDDLALLDGAARVQLAEVLALGRRVDEVARSGPPPRCDDLMDDVAPGSLSAAGHRLLGDVASGTATVTPAL